MHIPGYFSLRDINNEADAGKNNWPILQHQERISGNCRDQYRAGTTLDFEFGKDQLRQTMLKHETVFQHQLHELHRLYNTQRYMMNEVVKKEKPHELSVGDLMFFFPSESTRNKWWIQGSTSMKSAARFKNGARFDESKSKKTQRQLFDLEVSGVGYLGGDDEFPKVSVDTRQSFPGYHKNNGGDASGSWLNSTMKSRLFDLNESLPDIETTSQRFNLHMGASISSGGFIQCEPANVFAGREEHKGTVLSGIFSDNHPEVAHKLPHNEHRKLFRNSAESFGKKKIFGVEISRTNPSSNDCLKILGFSAPNNHREAQDLPSFISYHSKSASPTSVLLSGANSSTVESLNTDHVFQKPGVNQTVNGFSIDLNVCAEEGKEEEEEEEVRVVSLLRNGPRKLEIDLEAPLGTYLETSGAECEFYGDKSENETLHSEEEEEASAVLAAEALLHISLSCIEDSQANPYLLTWFADVISSHEVRSTSTGESIGFSENITPEKVDYFEYMTLKQPGITVEGCKDILQDNENSKAQDLCRNPRQRRDPRRGRRRQKKNFQRDVLPMLTSLSRKEAIDDLQVIGELLGDIGEKWEPGSTLIGKTGSGRGWKRLVCGETGLEERSLAGWGKRTRRPPSQRCVNNLVDIASK